MKRKYIYFEPIFALLFLITGIILSISKITMILPLTILLMVWLIFMLKNIKTHIYWIDKPILSVYSIIYKLNVYIAAIWIFADYPLKTETSLICIALCIGYMIFSYFNKRRYYEMLNAYMYWQTLGMLYFFEYAAKS